MSIFKRHAEVIGFLVAMNKKDDWSPSDVEKIDEHLDELVTLQRTLASMLDEDIVYE